MRRRCRTSFLRSEISILNTQIGQRPLEHLAESRRWVVSASPARCLEQLLAGWIESREVLPVLAQTLVDKGIQLEVDLVVPRREMHRQGIAEHLRLDTVEKAIGQAEIHKIRWAGIEPRVRHPEILRDLIPSFLECGRQRSALQEITVLDPRYDVNVFRASVDDLEREQSRTTDDYQLMAPRMPC